MPGRKTRGRRRGDGLTAEAKKDEGEQAEVLRHTLSRSKLIWWKIYCSKKNEGERYGTMGQYETMGQLEKGDGESLPADKKQ